MEAAPLSASLRREQFTQLGAQCAQLDASLEQIRSELERLTLERARFAPVHALPDDVWIEILKHAYLHQFPHCRSDKGTRFYSPISFTHVSRRFRQVAVALPSIWTCIHITPYQNENYFSVLELYLERSQDLPISVTFMCDTSSAGLHHNVSQDRHYRYTIAEPQDHYELHYDTCWHLILDRFYRVRHLALFMQHGGVLKHFLEFEEDGDPSGPPPLPLLECLEMYVHFGEQPCTLETTIEAPRLSDLRLYNVAPPLETQRFGNISKLVLTKWAPDEFVMPIRCALDPLGHSLEMLVLSTTRIDYDPAQPFDLPQLRYLILKDLHLDTDWSSLLLNFSVGAPKLSQLKILHEQNDLGELEWGTWTTVPIFGAMKEVTVDINTLVEPEESFPFFDAFPCVQHIYIAGLHAPFFLELLLEPWDASSHAQGTMWPFLEKLVYSPCDKPGDHKDLLLKLVEYRTTIGFPLRELVLEDTLKRDMTPQEIQILEDHVQEVVFRNLWDWKNIPDWDGDDDTPSMAWIEV